MKKENGTCHKTDNLNFVHIHKKIEKNKNKNIDIYIYTHTYTYIQKLNQFLSSFINDKYQVLGKNNVGTILLKSNDALKIYHP